MSILDRLYFILEFSELKNFNLAQYYDKFNIELFNGELPKIPMEYANNKSVGGYVDALRNKHTGEIFINKLVISSFFKRDLDNFIQILLHEMIHVWLLSHNEFEREQHGVKFNKKKREIEQKSGINIPETDTVASVVSDDIKSKDFDVVFIKPPNKYSIAVYKANFFNGDYDFELLKSKYIYPISVVQSNDRMLLKYPVQRSTKSIAFYNINNDDAERILNTGKLIREVKDGFIK